MLLQTKPNPRSYHVSSTNPFLFTSTNPHRAKLNVLDISTTLLSGNNSTKKRLPSGANKENVSHPNLATLSPSKEFDVFKPKLRTRLITRKRVELPKKKIYFEDEENGGTLKTFPLYEEQETYTSQPLSENVIPMVGDEDVRSDEEMIETGAVYLLNELKYGIVAFSQKRQGL